MSIPEPDDAVLAALHALDQDTSDVDPAVAADATVYADTVAALAEAASTPPNLALRGRVLAAAFAERDAGASIDDGGADAATTAFLRTARELDRVLRTLDALDWTERAHPAIGDVRCVVAHLLAIEHLVLDQLPDHGAPRPPHPTGLRAEGAGLSHIEWATPVVVASVASSFDELRRAWLAGAEALAAAASAAPPDATVDLHGLRVGVDGAMVMRTFEVWTHLDDIARATGRRRPRLDARRMRAMSRALMDALPIALHLAGHGDIEGRATVVLTGPGGGSYDVGLGGDDSSASCTITADVVDFCRVAADRASIDRIEVQLGGDRRIAEAVLASASVFAMD